MSKEYGLKLIKTLKKNTYSGIICAVAHDEFKLIKNTALKKITLKKSVIYDLKNIFPKSATDIRL